MKPAEACRRLWMKHERIVAALSGGADSVALLVALHETKSGRTLEAAHVNHNLRGAESDGDEAFCRELCEKLGVKLHVLSVDAAACARKNRESVETAARKIRYSYFERAAGGAAVATAHTADDNAETFFLNLVRGAGLAGLCAIPGSRGDIERPFLKTTRREVLEYLESKGQNYREDSSNSGNEYRRNRIRHAVIPALAAENPRFVENVAGTIEALNLDNALLCRLAEQLREKAAADQSGDAFDLETLRDAEKPLVMRIILSKGISGERAEQIYRLILSGETSQKRQISGERYAFVSYGKLIFGRPPRAGATFEIELKQGENRVPSGIIKLAFAENKFNNNLTNSAGDGDKINAKLTARTRRAGDKVTVNGAAKTLKKLMIDRKVPLEKRNSIPVVADRSGVLWTPLSGLEPRGEGLVKIDFIKDERCE